MIQRGERLSAIREILAARAVGTQDELRRLLRARGLRATQATLSRDLARLGVRRVHAAESGAVYELPQDGAPAPLLGARGLVSAVADNGQLVVVRTLPGAAPAVARALDEARLALVLGTVAGDDTVFVAPAQVRKIAPLVKRLRALLFSQD